MKKIISGIAGLILTIGFSTPALAAVETASTYNHWSSYSNIYTYTNKSCSLGRKALAPGYARTGTLAFRSPVSGYVKYSSGTIVRFSPNQCFITSGWNVTVYN